MFINFILLIVWSILMPGEYKFALNLQFKNVAQNFIWYKIT